MKDSPTIKVVDQSPLGATLCIAYIGAAVYFVGLSDGFWGAVWALLKAAVWPAYVLYHVLALLGVQ